MAGSTTPAPQPTTSPPARITSTTNVCALIPSDSQLAADTLTQVLISLGNSNSCDWGDITWGQFTSRDGVHWADGLPTAQPHPHSNPATPIIDRDQPYDKDGIFTGCLHCSGPYGETDQLTVFYTSVCHLPLHWTLQHTRNSEGLSMATSTDGGRTWTKHPGNPIIKGEPEEMSVTGFRDPFLASWPAMDKARGVDPSTSKTLYGAISGGLQGERPTAFLYAVQADNLTEWTYLGLLVDDVPLRFSAARVHPQESLTTWSGNFGANWECVNFMTLESPTDSQRTREFLVTGAEGGLKPGVKETDESPYGQWSLWMAGSLHPRTSTSSTVSTARMRHEYSGYLDHGCFYAANSYIHPVTNQRIVWGWLKEEDLSLARREAKGWTGYLSQPRELFLQTLDNVVGVIGAAKLEDISSISATANPRGKTTQQAHTIETLGMRPLPNQQAFRSSPARPSLSRTPAPPNKPLLLATTPSRTATSWELEAAIRIPRSASQQPQKVGFHIRHSRDLSQRCTVYFSPSDGRIYVDRSLSNTHDDVAKSDVSGPFALFVTSPSTSHRDQTEEEEEEEKVEPLHLRIFSDGDIIEIFANDRFALSTMVYSEEGCSGISTFVESDAASDVKHDLFESVHIWEGLGEKQSIHDVAVEAQPLLAGGRSAL